jgi:hypothetical protein
MTYRIKPLEWKIEEGGTPSWLAVSLDTFYRVFERVTEGRAHWVWKKYGDAPRVCASLEAGKAAAEAHWQARLAEVLAPIHGQVGRRCQKCGAFTAIRQDFCCGCDEDLRV